VHPIPGPFFNTGISVLKNDNTGNTGIIPVLKLYQKLPKNKKSRVDFDFFLSFFGYIVAGYVKAYLYWKILSN
jgi:hypothetical protein